MNVGETTAKPHQTSNQNEKGNQNNDYDDDRLQEMTASYSEISFDSQSSPPVSEPRPSIDSSGFSHKTYFDKVTACNRPDCLDLRGSNEFDAEEAKPDPTTSRKAMGYLQSEGTVMKDGDLVLFVTEDLENKIKLSSPITKKGDLSESRISTPCLYRQALNPQLPPLDHNILNELENEARKAATSVDSITENLAAILHSASALTVGCLETYRDAVCKTCDAVDHNIKSIYQLMAKCEELSKAMEIIYKSEEKIKDIKKMVELFEHTMNS